MANPHTTSNPKSTQVSDSKEIWHIGSCMSESDVAEIHAWADNLADAFTLCLGDAFRKDFRVASITNIEPWQNGGFQVEYKTTQGDTHWFRIEKLPSAREILEGGE